MGNIVRHILTALPGAHIPLYIYIHVYMVLFIKATVVIAYSAGFGSQQQKGKTGKRNH